MSFLPDPELAKQIAPVVTILLGAGKAAGAASKAIGHGVQFLRRWAFADDPQQLQSRREAISQVAASGLSLEAIDALYPTTSLTAAGFQREIVVVGQVHRPTSIVSVVNQDHFTATLNPSTETAKLMKAPPHRCMPTPQSAGFAAAEIVYSGATVWDQDIYRLLRCQIEPGRFTLEFGLDTFGTYRAGIGALPGELLQALVDAKHDVDLLARESGTFLPLRSHFLPDVGRLLKLDDTLSVGGVSLLVAMRRTQLGRDDYVMPLQVRSSKVSGNRGVLGVIPHAFHQPMINPYEETALSSTCLREIFEELFEGAEVEKGATHLAPDWYLGTHPAMKWLDEHRDAWSLRLTGFGFDMKHGGYEAAMLIVIHDPGFYKQFSHLMRPNWEVDSAQSLDPRTEHLGLSVAQSPLPMVSSLQSEQLEEVLMRRSWAGAGLWCFSRGLATLAEIDPPRVAST